MEFFAPDIPATERRRVTEAITLAEKTTRGEIVVVAARASDDYIHVPIYIATALALATPLFAPLIAKLFPWSQLSILALFLVQLCVFIVVALVLSLPALRLKITPRKLMQRYAHRNAASQFLASSMANTQERTGMLIFVSMLERYVEVIGDEAISAKLTHKDWQKIIDEMLPLLKAGKTSDALVHAVERCGALLKEHFPARKHNPNELPDRFIVLN